MEPKKKRNPREFGDNFVDALIGLALVLLPIIFAVAAVLLVVSAVAGGRFCA